MPLLIKSVVITALLSIPVFGGSIIGANYGSPILHHLVDVVSGSNTQTVSSLNAPNWASGIPLSQPVGLAAATSTSGSLATSTTWYFKVAALDGTGTTTASDNAGGTTDSTTGESLKVTWASVTGATGYAIYFSTTTATNFSRYFLATSTNGVPNASYIFSTSTGSLAGSNTLLDSTAFSTKINPTGQSYLNGGGLQVLGQTLISTTTAASSSALEINGYTRASLSATSTACFSATKGEMFFNTSNGHEWGCDGTNWIKVF